MISENNKRILYGLVIIAVVGVFAIAKRFDIQILNILPIMLILAAFLKNYYYYLYNNRILNQSHKTSELIRSIIGSKIVGPFWIFPFRISEKNRNSEIQRIADLFNLYSTLHLIFWGAIVIYGIPYFFAMFKHN